MRNYNGAISAALAVILVLLQASRLSQSSQTNATGTIQQEIGEAVKDEPPDSGKLQIENYSSDNNSPNLNVNQLPSKNVQAHSSFLTMDKKAHLSGIRIEPVEIGEEGFIGYNEKGISIVLPNQPVRVVLFGSFLDDVVLIGFTTNDNCSETLANVHQSDFTIQTERRVVIIYEFEESESIYKICMKQKAIDYVLPFTLVILLKWEN